LDLDLVVPIGSGWVLIAGVHPWSDGSGGLGARGGGAAHGARRRAAAEPPEFALPAPQGWVWARVGPGSMLAVCANHWGVRRGVAGLVEGSSPVQGGSDGAPRRRAMRWPRERA